MRLTTPRGRTLSRLVAVWLVLIALHFTVPFQTFVLGATSCEAANAAVKDITLAASLVFVPPSPSSPLARLDVGRAFPGVSHHYRILPTVLRL